MDGDTTDAVLGGLTAATLALCLVGVLVHACRTSRQPRLKPSRSDSELSSMVNQDPVVVVGESTTRPFSG